VNFNPKTKEMSLSALKLRKFGISKPHEYNSSDSSNDPN